MTLLQRKLATVPGADESVRRVCTRIEGQARHLTRLVDDLLDISRISSGKIDLRWSEVTLQEIIEQP